VYGFTATSEAVCSYEIIKNKYLPLKYRFSANHLYLGRKRVTHCYQLPPNLKITENPH